MFCFAKTIAWFAKCEDWILRHTYFLEWVIRNHLKNELKDEDFPWINRPSGSNQQSKSSARSYRNRNTSEQKSNVKTNGARIIIYVLGLQNKNIYYQTFFFIFFYFCVCVCVCVWYTMVLQSMLCLFL